MSDTVIRVSNLGKKYVIGHQQKGRSQQTTLRDTITNSIKSFGSSLLTRKEKDTLPSNQEEFWALKDVSFEVKQGEVVGIIGRNGAGKSTLLKILSQITEPTTGEIEITGRVASLLEVGTGFHPELTGRENIYLNGSILGMSRTEINKRFDEIVEFSEVEKFLDTPVKHYSSGMYVRLAFAVTAHLEPEILIVDEVLAVGDYTFQKKCLGKMEDIAINQGRTIFFVSHNITAVQSLCSRVILLRSGNLISNGNPENVTEEYLQHSKLELVSLRTWDSPDSAPGNDLIRLKSVCISSNVADALFPKKITVLTPIKIELKCWILARDISLNFSIVIYNQEEVCVLNTVSKSILLNRGLVNSVCHIPGNLLNNSIYRVRLLLVKDTSIALLDDHNIAGFEVLDIERQGNWYGKWVGVVRPEFEWNIESNN